MPIRRHIQEEESPRIHDSSNLSSLSLNNPSLASQLSLRDRKLRIAGKVSWADFFLKVNHALKINCDDTI